VKNGGYTLVEILVVIGVVGILSGTALSYNRMAGSNLTIFRTQAVLIGYLNRAKALSQQRFNSERVCAFGVYFAEDGKSFLIFGDKIEDPAKTRCRDRVGLYAGNGVYDVGSDQIIDLPLILESGISLNSEVYGKGIVFLPPDLTASTTFIQADGTVGLPLTTVITGASGTRTVRVGEGGQISTNE
jgi:prepilin-type N-terminal cleavage/methylation domain-containing protein